MKKLRHGLTSLTKKAVIGRRGEKKRLTGIKRHFVKRCRAVISAGRTPGGIKPSAWIEVRESQEHRDGEDDEGSEKGRGHADQEEPMNRKQSDRLGKQFPRLESQV